MLLPPAHYHYGTFFDTSLTGFFPKLITQGTEEGESRLPNLLANFPVHPVLFLPLKALIDERPSTYW